MAGLLYWLPKLDRSIKIEDVRAAGLGHAFERGLAANTFHGKDGKKPFGAAGVTFADPDRVQKIGVYDGQTWKQAPGQKFWIGWYDNQRPGPGDLARSKMLDGHCVRLADGNDYLAPVARGWNDSDDDPGWFHAVPRLTELDDAGNWIQGDVVAAYRPLWELATAWWDMKNRAAEAVEEGAEQVRVDFEIDTFAGLNDAAAFALGQNYRVSKYEIAALGLFDTHSAQRILDALVDGPTFRAWLEKKTPAAGEPTSVADGSSIDGGVEE